MSETAQIFDRLPPNSLEAEAAVLGAAMMDPVALHMAIQILHESDFYRGSHRLIFRAMQDLLQREKEVDLITVMDCLQASGNLEAAGGPMGLASLSEKVASATNVESYARIVKEKSKLRKLIKVCEDSTKDAFNRQEESSLVIDTAMSKILSIAEASEDDFEHAGSGWEADFAEMEETSIKGQRRGYPIRLQGWNNKIGGIIPGKVYVIGARPGTGKSALALNMASDLVSLKVPTAFFSLEMDKNQMRNRIVAASADVDGWKIEQGFMNTSELSSYRQVMRDLKGKPLHFYYDPGLTLVRLMALMRVAVLRFRVKAIFIDYLQMLSDDSQKHSTPAQEMTHIARTLARFARSQKVAIIEAAQLNRDNSKMDREPRKADLKESGGIEEAADVICLLHEVDRDQHEGQPIIPVKFIYDKHRGGPTGQQTMQYVRRFLRFEE